MAVRATGSTNVVVADGLQYAIQLDGAPALTDPAGEVAYAVHPYFHSAAAETQATWSQNFGTLAATAPVIVTEWTTVANAATSGSTYFCDSTTAGAALRLMDYLASKKIGITAFAYDFSGNVFGSAAYGSRRNRLRSRTTRDAGRWGMVRGRCFRRGFGVGVSLHLSSSEEADAAQEQPLLCQLPERARP